MSKYEKDGLFIVVDGVDGTGKTSLGEAIADYINRAYPHLEVVRSNEKQCTSLGRLCTEVMHGEWCDKERLAPRTRWMLYEASRTQHNYEVVTPTLMDKQVLIQDRYIESTIAYQSADCMIDHRNIARVVTETSSDMIPDLTFITDCSLETLRDRLARRNKLSYFEKKGPDFLRRVRTTYLDRIEDHRVSWSYYITKVNTEGEKGTAIHQCTDAIDHCIHNKILRGSLPAGA